MQRYDKSLKPPNDFWEKSHLMRLSLLPLELIACGLWAISKRPFRLSLVGCLDIESGSSESPILLLLSFSGTSSTKQWYRQYQTTNLLTGNHNPWYEKRAYRLWLAPYWIQVIVFAIPALSLLYPCSYLSLYPLYTLSIRTQYSRAWLSHN